MLNNFILVEGSPKVFVSYGNVITNKDGIIEIVGLEDVFGKFLNSYSAYSGRISINLHHNIHKLILTRSRIAWFNMPTVLSSDLGANLFEPNHSAVLVFAILGAFAGFCAGKSASWFLLPSIKQGNSDRYKAPLLAFIFSCSVIGLCAGASLGFLNSFVLTLFNDPTYVILVNLFFFLITLSLYKAMKITALNYKNIMEFIVVSSYYTLILYIIAKLGILVVHLCTGTFLTSVWQVIVISEFHAANTFNPIQDLLWLQQAPRMESVLANDAKAEYFNLYKQLTEEWLETKNKIYNNIDYTTTRQFLAQGVSLCVGFFNLLSFTQKSQLIANVTDIFNPLNAFIGSENSKVLVSDLDPTSAAMQGVVSYYIISKNPSADYLYYKTCIDVLSTALIILYNKNCEISPSWDFYLLFHLLPRGFFILFFQHIICRVMYWCVVGQESTIIKAIPIWCSLETKLNKIPFQSNKNITKCQIF